MILSNLLPQKECGRFHVVAKISLTFSGPGRWVAGGLPAGGPAGGKSIGFAEAAEPRLVEVLILIRGEYPENCAPMYRFRAKRTPYVSDRILGPISYLVGVRPSVPMCREAGSRL